MQLIKTYEQCDALKRGDRLRRIFEKKSTDYQVHQNNNMGTNVDLLVYPLLTPSALLIKGRIVRNHWKISGSFGINRYYKELVDGSWYII